MLARPRFSYLWRFLESSAPREYKVIDALLLKIFVRSCSFSSSVVCFCSLTASHSVPWTRSSTSRLRCPKMGNSKCFQTNPSMPLRANPPTFLLTPTMLPPSITYGSTVSYRSLPLTRYIPRAVLVSIWYLPILSVCCLCRSQGPNVRGFLPSVEGVFLYRGILRRYS